jgi:hypothetical protein
MSCVFTPPPCGPECRRRRSRPANGWVFLGLVVAGRFVVSAAVVPNDDVASRLRHGSPWLKTMLVQCAWAAKRKKDIHLARAVPSPQPPRS